MSRIGGRSFTMGFRVMSETQGVEVATGEQVMVVFDYGAGRAVKVDEKVRGAIEALEAEGGGERGAP